MAAIVKAEWQMAGDHVSKTRPPEGSGGRSATAAASAVLVW